MSFNVNHKQTVKNKIAPSNSKSDLQPSSAETGKNDIPEENRSLCSIPLKKTMNSTNTPSQLFVVPVPEQNKLSETKVLDFKSDHFNNENIDLPNDILINNVLIDDQSINLDQNIPVQSDEQYPVRSSRKDSRKKKVIKLPLGVELTAGSGSLNKMNSNLKKDSPLPSDLLFASASVLKSYLGFSQENSSGEIEADESMKEKFMALWHNMKYGWSANLKTNFSRETPIYLLGKVYHKTFKEDSAYQGSGFTCSNIEGFKQDFFSIPWFTYRRKFPLLSNSNLTSDCGWGCMIRSAQMIVATALTRHFLPPGWRYNMREDDPQSSIHRQIMKWFCDSPSKQSPFSIHNLVSLGHKMNKKAGSWFGPSCVAHIFKEAVATGVNEVPALDKLTIYVAQDGAIYIQDVLDACSTGKCICRCENSTTASCSEASFDHCRDASTLDEEGLASGGFSEPYSVINKFGFEEDVPIDLFVSSNREIDKIKTSKATSHDDSAKEKNKSQNLEDNICEFCQGWKSCLILIPVRLGGSHVNPIYHNCLYSLFLHDLCIGIIGGKPKHSLYFVGFQENSLVHLDPHLSQDALSPDDPVFPTSSYHCSSPKKIPLTKMDPSATIGFYCHTKDQFLRLLQEVSQVATARDGNMDSPIFEFIDGKSSDLNGWLNQTLDEETARISMAETPPSSLDESEILSLD